MGGLGTANTLLVVDFLFLDLADGPDGVAAGLVASTVGVIDVVTGVGKDTTPLAGADGSVATGAIATDGFDNSGGWLPFFSFSAIDLRGIRFLERDCAPVDARRGFKTYGVVTLKYHFSLTLRG